MITPEEAVHGGLLYSGHPACPGCGAALLVRYLTRALGEKTAFVITASCWSIIAGLPPLTSLKCPILHCPFPSAAAVGSGVKRALLLKGDRETTVVVLSGDGGTFDIGFQALSGAAQRNEDFIFVCYDNEAYMNTGGQTSSATPYGTRTATAPFPLFQNRPKKDMIKIMAAHSIPYAATATVAFIDDLEMKFAAAREMKGFRFFHLLSPCPPGWGSEPDETIHLSRLAVESSFFPLYEVRQGENFKLTYRPAEKKPIDEYLQRQRRFRGLEKEQVEAMQWQVDRNWEKLLRKASPDSEK